MNRFVKSAMRLARSRKGRRVLSALMPGIAIFLAVSLGAAIAVVTAPVSNGIPMIDSAETEITDTYPWPLNGAVTCGYGWRTLSGENDFHQGLDISTGKNDPVIAIADGVVERVGIDKKSYGLYVLIRHDDGFYTLCAHLAKAYIKEGDRVEQGEKIALEGGEPGVDPYPGRSTGRHLHFEVRQTADENSRMDPLLFLNK